MGNSNCARKSVLFLFIALFYLSIPSFGTNIDSLMQVLKTTDKDTTRVNVLRMLFWEYERSDPEKGKEYIDQSLDLAKNIYYPSGISKGKYAMSVYYDISGDYSKSLLLLTEAQNEFELQGDSMMAINCLVDISSLHKRQNNYPEATQAILEAINYFERKGKESDLARAYNVLGNLYFSTNDHQLALTAYQKALAICEKIDLKLGIAVCSGRIASTYFHLNKFDDAGTWYQKTIHIQEELNDKVGLAKTWNNLGLLHVKRKQYHEALKVHKKAIRLYTELDYKEGIAIANQNIGEDYYYLKEFQKAIPYFELAIELSRELNHVEIEASALGTLSICYSEIGQHKKAFDLLIIHKELSDSMMVMANDQDVLEMQTRFQTKEKQKQIEILNKENEIKNLKIKRKNFGFYTALGFILILALSGWYIIRLLKQRQKARELLRKQETDLTLMENLGNYLKIANLLPMVVFILTKDRKLNFVSDSGLKLLGVSRDDVDKGFDLFSLLTEKDKKTFEIDVENALNDKPTKGKSYRFRLKDDSTLPVLGFLSPNTEDNKTTGVLGVMMDVSEMKKMEKELLSAVINTEDRERKRFSADLHDSLGPLLSSIKLYLGGLTDANEKEKLEMLAYTEELIDESIKSVRTISNNIMPRTLSEEGFYASLRSFADKLEFTRAIQVNFGNKMPDKRYDSSTEVILYRIMQELINNTIKHAQADNIFINFKEVGNQLIIDYRDDGKGFNTNKTDLTGLGLKNIRDRVKSLNGNIVFSSKEGEGTEVHLKIDV